MTALFLLSVGFCVYTLFVYPLLLGIEARLRSRPVRKAAWPATVSVILPVHNGARWIGAKLESILALDYPADLVEILIVSDGFHGKNLLDRHRMIYQALDVPMKDGRIHALELTARTKDEA